MSKRVIISLIALLVAGGSLGGYKIVKDNQASVFEDSVHMVTRVVDGDTVDILPAPSIARQAGENKKRIRLLGIDSPERDSCYFGESKQALKDLIEGQDIRIEKDISGTDRYDRFLRYVYMPAENPKDDDLFVNEWLVREGYAFTFGEAPDNRYRDLLARAEGDAREAERGLWSEVCEYSESFKDAKSLREEGSAPQSPECTIKGNISEKGYGKLYFLEGCPNYERVKVDSRKGEAWFCSENEAIDAGFQRSESCDNTF